LKAIGKLPVESKRSIFLVITGRRTDAQSFRREVRIALVENVANNMSK